VREQWARHRVQPTRAGAPPGRTLVSARESRKASAELRATRHGARLSVLAGARCESEERQQQQRHGQLFHRARGPHARAARGHATLCGAARVRARARQRAGPLRRLSAQLRTQQRPARNRRA